MAINFTAPSLSQPDKVTDNNLSGYDYLTNTQKYMVKGSLEWLIYCGKLGTIDEVPDYPRLPEPAITCEEYVASKFRDLPIDHQGGDCSNDPEDVGGNGAIKACEDLVNNFEEIKKKQRDERIKEARAELESVVGGTSGTSGGTSASGGSTVLGQGGVEVNTKFYYIMGPNGLVKCYCDSRANTAPSDGVGGSGGGDEPSLAEKEAARRKFDEFMKDEEELKEREDACTPAQIKACSCFFVLVNIYDPVACGQCNPCRLYCRCISKFVGHYEYMFFDAGAAQSFAEGLRTPMNCCNNYACERVYKTTVTGGDFCTDDACKVTPDDVDPNFPMGWCGPSGTPIEQARGADNFAKYYCSPSGPGYGVQHYRGD